MIRDMNLISNQILYTGATKKPLTQFFNERVLAKSKIQGKIMYSLSIMTSMCMATTQRVDRFLARLKSGPQWLECKA